MPLIPGPPSTPPQSPTDACGSSRADVKTTIEAHHPTPPERNMFRRPFHPRICLTEASAQARAQNSRSHRSQSRLRCATGYHVRELSTQCRRLVGLSAPSTRHLAETPNPESLSHNPKLQLPKNPKLYTEGHCVVKRMMSLAPLANWNHHFKICVGAGFSESGFAVKRCLFFVKGSLSRALRSLPHSNSPGLGGSGRLGVGQQAFWVRLEFVSRRWATSFLGATWVRV